MILSKNAKFVRYLAIIRCTKHQHTYFDNGTSRYFFTINLRSKLSHIEQTEVRPELNPQQGRQHINESR